MRQTATQLGLLDRGVGEGAGLPVGSASAPWRHGVKRLTLTVRSTPLDRYTLLHSANASSIWCQTASKRVNISYIVSKKRCQALRKKTSVTLSKAKTLLHSSSKCLSSEVTLILDLIVIVLFGYCELWDARKLGTGRWYRIRMYGTRNYLMVLYSSRTCKQIWS
jgi:hypothetical protein